MRRHDSRGGPSTAFTTESEAIADVFCELACLMMRHELPVMELWAVMLTSDVTGMSVLMERCRQRTYVHMKALATPRSASPSVQLLRRFTYWPLILSSRQHQCVCRSGCVIPPTGVKSLCLLVCLDTRSRPETMLSVRSLILFRQPRLRLGATHTAGYLVGSRPP